MKSNGAIGGGWLAGVAVGCRRPCNGVKAGVWRLSTGWMSMASANGING